MLLDRAIFFDIDDTLVATKSMFDFQRYYFTHARAHRGDDPDLLMTAFRADLAAAVPDGQREGLNRAFYRSFKDRDVGETEAFADAWFAALPPSIWIESACELLAARCAAGYSVVGVSGSSHEILRGVHGALGFDHLLAATLERRNGRFTGELIPPQTIGAGKRVAMETLAIDQGFDLSASTACGDHISDLPMLEAVGEAIVVSGDPELEAVALARGWTVLPREARLEADLHV